MCLLGFIDSLHALVLPFMTTRMLRALGMTLLAGSRIASEITTLPMFHPGQDLALGRAVALQFIRDDDPWDVLTPFERFVEELLRRVLIATALHQNVEDVVVLVDGTPQVMALPIDRQKHLIQMPFVPRARPSVLQLIGVRLPKLETPLADGLVGHVDAALEQEFLSIAVAQREAIIQPDAMTNDLPRKAVVLVAFGDQRVASCRLPLLRFAWSVREHHGGHYVTDWEGWSTT